MLISFLDMETGQRAREVGRSIRAGDEIGMKWTKRAVHLTYSGFMVTSSPVCYNVDINKRSGELPP
jgi:hypothetical protein